MTPPRAGERLRGIAVGRIVAADHDIVMQPPTIQTAVPKRRYQFGPYEAVVLGEIESPDPVRYAFILALVRVGQGTPSLYVTAESEPGARPREGAHRLRVVSEEVGEELVVPEAIRNADDFAAVALAAAGKALGLAGIAPVRVA
jgi:hypothetical protein